MACVRRRRGRWVLDYRDHLGIRRTPSFPTKERADQELARVLGAPASRAVAAVSPDITVADYAARWLDLIVIEESTRVQYERTLRLYVLPAIGATKVRKLRRTDVKAMLSERVRAGLARDTVRLIHSNLRTMLNAARDDELIHENPTEGLGRILRLTKAKETRRQEIKAFDRAQLAQLLDACRTKDAELYPLLLTLAATGVRPGEALALEWDDFDAGRSEIRIERALADGRLKKPKSGHGRTVDIWPLLGDVVRVELRRRSLSAAGPLMFPSTAGTHLDHHNVARRFRRLLRLAKLPLHHSIKCLRHTYASILLAEGESPAYVQRQLGHASISLTVDTYGRFLRITPRAVDPRAARLVANSSEVVAAPGTASPQVADGIGDPGRARTFNPEIKSILRAPSGQDQHSVNRTESTRESDCDSGENG